MVNAELNDTQSDSELIKNQTSRNQVIMDRYNYTLKVLLCFWLGNLQNNLNDECLKKSSFL